MPDRGMGLGRRGFLKATAGGLALGVAPQVAPRVTASSPLPRRPLGSTGLTVPILGLGTALAGRLLDRDGAVAVVHGYKMTATLQVQDYYENFNQAGAYGVSLMLAVMAVIVLVSMILIRPREALD